MQPYVHMLPCPPLLSPPLPNFLCEHALVLRRVEICEQESDLMFLNLTYSGGLSMDLRENWVARGHEQCHGFVNPTGPTAVVNFF